MTANTDELFCVLLALDGERLLLPRQALVEAVAWAELLPMPGAPAWYPGTLNWNGQSLPVVSFEAMLGRDVTMLTGRTRIALLRTVGDRDSEPLKPAGWSRVEWGFVLLESVHVRSRAA